MRTLFIIGGMMVLFLGFSFHVSTAHAATLSLNPSTKTVSVGDTFTVSIHLDTAGDNTDGVDVYFLRYNPSLLEVQDADVATQGVQVQAGTLYPNTLTNMVDTSNGAIDFSQTSSGGSMFNGSGDLATITFKALSAGTASVTFDFTPGSTTDSNVAKAGTDVLSSVTNGTYTINVPDTTAPVISGVQVGNITETAGMITWTTNELATGRVEYGITTSYGNTTTLSSLVTSHSHTIQNLSAGQTYHFRIRVKDAADNEAIGIDRTFTTQSAPQADTTPPAAIADLASSNIQQTSVDLSWSSPGDDGTQGTAQSYELRYATFTLTQENFSQGTKPNGLPSPSTAGSTDSYTLIGLSPGTTYTIAIKAQDEAGNISSISNVLSLTTLSSGSSPQPQPKVTITSPNTSSCFAHDEVLAIQWTRENVDHVALYYTLDGGTTVPSFGGWFFMQEAGATVTEYQWIVPTSVISDTVRIWVEGHDASHTQRLAIDASDANISFKSSCQTPSEETSPAPTPAPSTGGGGGGSSGGGGGGFFSPSDSTPPPQITNIDGYGLDGQVILTWENPSDPDYARTIVVRKKGSSPTSAADGTIIFDGTGQTVTDTNLENGAVYYYAVYTVDRVPNYSLPITIIVVPKEGVTQTGVGGAGQQPQGQGSTIFLPAPPSSGRVAESSRFRMPAGLREGDLIYGPDGIKVYIISQYGYKRHIFNPVVFSMYQHFRWNAIKRLDQGTFDAFFVSDLYRASKDPRVFALEEIDEVNGIAHKRHFSITAQEFASLGFDWNQVFTINDQERDYYQEGQPLTFAILEPVKYFGKLVKTADSPTIFYVNRTGVKKPIPNEAVFFSYNNRYEDVVTISQAELDRYEAFDAIRLPGDEKIYIIEQGMKRWIPSLDVFNRLGLQWTRVVSVNQTEFNTYPEGSPVQ